MPIEFIQRLLMRLYNVASEQNFGFHEGTFEWMTAWYVALGGPDICGNPSLDDVHQGQFVVAYLLNVVGWILTGSMELVPMVGYGGCGS